MGKSILLTLVCLLISLPAAAQRVPGTSVILSPPAGFALSENFPGFVEKSTGSSIRVSEISGQYKDFKNRFSQKDHLMAQGMKLLDKSAVEVDGHAALLLNVGQFINGTIYTKWILGINRDGDTTLVVARYPDSYNRQQGENLKKALLDLTLVKHSDPSDKLPFTIEPEAPFKVAKIINEVMFLTPDGQFPLTDPHVPLMILGSRKITTGEISERKALAERIITGTGIIKNVSAIQSNPIKIGQLSGLVTTGQGVNKDTSLPLRIYQVLLFDKPLFCFVQGVVPLAEKNIYMPLFEKIAKTFKMKDAPTK